MGLTGEGESMMGKIVQMNSAMVTYAQQLKKVMLCVGHGDSLDGPLDSGAQGKGESELNMNIRRARIIEAILIRSGYGVTIIGGNDTTLTERGNLSKGQDCFVELHLNAYNCKAQGTETFYPKVDLDESISLATCIQNSCVKYMGLNDRGVKDAGYTCINTAINYCKAVCLTEAYFIDACQDRDEIIKKADLSAVAIAHGIMKYFQQY